ncbi:MAG: hypothetical protein F6K41_26265 [Symploca sp. SIO3E6]|nr:hypothetical protein [Caldora sp. SIO3E6]
MRRVLWWRRVLLTIVGVVGILSINLVMPVKGVTQSVQQQELLVVPESFRGKIGSELT